MADVNLILVVALLVSNAYWLYQVQRLVDKLMSRNYQEYQMAKEYKMDKPQAYKRESFDHPAENLDVLNQMITS